MQLPIVFLLSSPFPTQCKAAVTTVGSEKPSTFFTVRSTHGLNSSTSRFGRDIPPVLQNNIKCTSSVIIHWHWWNCLSAPCFKTLCTCVGLYHTDVTHMIQPPSFSPAHPRTGAKHQRPISYTKKPTHTVSLNLAVVSSLMIALAWLTTMLTKSNIRAKFNYIRQNGSITR